MNTFEKYLDDFNSTINIWEFALNLVIVVVIAYVIKLFYIHYGRAISDRRKFSNIFIPLAIGTMIIIMVIKSSIALSLGLVGALSIVRFRSAIKDPEELTMLFLVIALGLIGGVNKPILAVASFAMVLPVLYLNSRLGGNKKTVTDKAFLNIKSSVQDVSKIVNAISPSVAYLEIKRIDEGPDGLSASFFCSVSKPEAIQQIMDAVKSLDSEAEISFVEQPDLLL